MKGIQGERGFTTLELGIVMLILAIVAAIAIDVYRGLPDRVKVAAAAAEVSGCFRAPLSAYAAVHGEWPKDWEALEEMLPAKRRHQKSAIAAEYRLENGAVTVLFAGGETLRGKLGTVHPAVPAGDPLGPVKFVVGPISLASGWVLIGKDHTTVDMTQVQKNLRR